MAIKKDITLDATGGVANFHTVRVVALELMAKTTNATLMSYVSEDAFKAGKQPATFQMITVAVNGLPADGQSALDYVEAELVRKVTDADQNLAGNRALFEGGVVV